MFYEKAKKILDRQGFLSIIRARKDKKMTLPLNITPATPEDLAAFSAEYAEWNALVEQGIPPEEPEEYPDEEYDPFLTDAEADADVFASCGWGTDEDYGYYGDGSW